MLTLFIDYNAPDEIYYRDVNNKDFIGDSYD